MSLRYGVSFVAVHPYGELKAGYTCNNNFLLPPSIFEFFSSMEAWAHFRKMY